MDMKLPGSGSLLEALFHDGSSALDSGDGCVVSNVSESQLLEAVDAMVRGDIEFVILEQTDADGGGHGDAFFQAAGEGDGPYEINYKPANDDTLQAVAGGVSGDAMRAALLSYRRGDGRWHVAHRWVPIEF